MSTSPKIPVIIALGDFAGGVTSWAFRLRDAMAGHPRYQIQLMNCADTGNHIGRFDLHASTQTRARDLLAASGQAIVIPNFVWDLFPLCAELIAGGQALRCVGFCRADSDEEYYAPLAWYRPLIHSFAAVSPHCAARLQAKLDLDPGQVHTLPTGVQVPADLDRSYQTDPIRLAYGGRLVQAQKRIMDFVPLVECLYKSGTDFRLSIAGTGRERDALHHALLPVDREKRVRFVTRKKPGAMPAFWERHDVFLQTSEFEGTSNSMLEAMARGTVPVVTHTQSGVDGIVIHGENGMLVPVGDMAAMARCVETLAADRERLAALGHQAHAAMLPYAIERYVERFVTLLDEAAAAPLRTWPAEVAITPPRPFHGIRLAGGGTVGRGRIALLFPSPLRGGAEDYTLTLAAGAVRAGYDVQGCFSGRRALKGLIRDYFEVGAFHNTLEICDVGEKAAQAPPHKRFTRTYRLMRRLRPRAVIYQLCGMQYGLLSLLACAVLRLPTLVVFQLVRDDLRFSPLRRLLYRWMRARGQAYVAVSEANRQLLARAFAMPVEGIHVVPNGVNLARYQKKGGDVAACRTRIRASLGLPPDAILCLTVGRLSSQKGHDVLVPALPHVVARHPQVRFIWAGDGPLLQALKRQVATYGMSKYVHFLGKRDDIPELLHAADLFIHPSRFEGQPFSLLEAMAAEVPIVSTTASGIREVIEDNVHGLLCRPDDIAALRDRILEGLADPARMARLAEAGRLRVEAFSERSMVERTLELLEARGLPQ